MALRFSPQSADARLSVASARKIGVFLFLLAVAGAFLLPYVVRSERVEVVDADERRMGFLNLRTFDGVQYFASDDLTNLLDGNRFSVEVRKRFNQPTQRLSLQFRSDENSTTLRMKLGDSRVQIDGGDTVELKASLRYAERDAWVPIDFLTELVPSLMPLQVSYASGSSRLTIVDENAPEEAPPTEKETPPAVTPTPVPVPGGTTYLSTPVSPPRWNEMVVALDPGHGGGDRGVIANGTSEQGLALAVAQEVQRVAFSVGAKVSLTRTSDTRLSTIERANAANAAKANVYVAIHFNSSRVKDKQGYRIYVNYPTPAAVAPASVRSGAHTSSQLAYAEASRSLASLLKDALNEAGFEGQDPEELPMETVRRVRMPAVHLELGYLTNPEEAGRWRDPQTVRRVAEALWSGLAQYLPE